MEKMGKGEFITAVAEKSEMTKKDVSTVYEAFVEVITEQLSAKNKISLVGFGNFEVAHRAARTGVNPTTKEKIDIEAKDVPKFKFAGTIKNAVK